MGERLKGFVDRFAQWASVVRGHSMNCIHPGCGGGGCHFPNSEACAVKQAIAAQEAAEALAKAEAEAQEKANRPLPF